MTTDEKKKWCIQQHVDTNHYYDVYLPYEFHLRLVHNVYQDFKYLLDELWKPICEIACFSHDLIEDTRANYNEVKKVLGLEVAEITRAVTNYGRGRNRNERMPDFVYDDIRNTPGATFVKLCDRIANVQYGILTKSGMVGKYKQENPHFLQMLGLNDPEHRLKPMVDYLVKLFEN